MTNSDSIVHFIDKPRAEWVMEDWQKWSAFCEVLSAESQDEFHRVLKENLELKQKLEKYESYIAKKFGMPKRVKTKGLLTSPRGRPMKPFEKNLISSFVKDMKYKGKTWIEIADLIDIFNYQNNTKYPKSERYLRELTKTAE